LLDGLTINGARNVLVNITAGTSLGIREATAATAIIQSEAGDDVEVIFGTVIDDAMGDDIRITVIATGFEKNRKKEAIAARRVELTPKGYRRAPVPYKGEEGLKELDKPAYERRGAPLNVEPNLGDGGDETGSTRVRLLSADEIKDVEKVDTTETEVPAFLRKMMD
jgi:cell division protein FtsZ